MLITGQLSGVPPGRHGFHIHEHGDLRKGCTSAGAHFSLSGHNHGAPTAKERHEGDLGNIVAGPDGKVTINMTDPILIIRGPQSIIGRALVIHEKEDDLGNGRDEESLKTGNAGGRIACAIIGRTS
ncbi:hypothetical protein M513_10059 [Trichuris suis]|nr:hypothetical protein M513_10059 [Trichuris suis]